MSDLKTDYKDDVLDVSANVKRIFNLVDQDGKIVVANVSIQDITKYTQEGDTFGAADINATNEAVNGKLDGSSTVNPMLATEEGFAADAYQTKLQFEEQNKKLEWKLVGSVTGKNNIITLPSDFNELDIACKGKDNKYKLHMIREELLDTDTKLITGYGSSSDPNYVSIYCNTSQVKVASMYEKGEDVTNKAVLTVYYR